MGGFAKNPPKDVITMINTTELSEPTEEEKKAQEELANAKTDEEKNKVLLKHGKPLPCIICKKPKGWIKYSSCCSRPIHPLCIKNTITCPGCGFKPLKLAKEITKPQNAMYLEKDGGNEKESGEPEKKAE
mmetsp:Transcript_570/g.503  ORF Transcript_570/g.503 Transcript_570/m.503 type:complete len:130 (+) Transcript_570:600-989(+)